MNPSEQKQSLVPIPDPTVLTTAALQIAIASLKELLEAKIIHSHDVLESKLNATNILKEEKFKETWERLDRIETQRLEAKGDNERSLAAALKSQEQLFAQINRCNEEATGKSESSFTRQIESLKAESSLSRAAIYDKIDSLKDIVRSREGIEGGRNQEKGQANWMIGLFVIGGMSACGLVVSVIALFMHVPK